ncbi:MAG: hypothetical protein M1837_004227 [Sclerophora amabilis]|nr:MAG: hypothetical protein M1837_004227 [Sclerophora amabilis]
MTAMTSTGLETQSSLVNYSLNGDEDAEYEDDPAMVEGAFAVDEAVPALDYEGSDVDAEGEEVEEEENGPTQVYEASDANEAAMTGVGGEEETGEDNDEEGEAVGPVKLPHGEEDSEGDEAEEDAASFDQASDESDNDSDQQFTDVESDVEGGWEEASEAANDEAEIVNPNRCIYCNEDEDNDPSEDYEEYLACAVCGDNSHRQCARKEGSLPTDEGQTNFLDLYDAVSWRCPTCVANALEPDSAEDSTTRRRSDAPKITRDLLPVQRGAARPGSHSVFNQLIVNDDPLDGSRLLRKRKASSDDVEEPHLDLRKRRKGSNDGSELDASAISLEEAQDDDADQVKTEVHGEEDAAADPGGNEEHGAEKQQDADVRQPSSPRPCRPVRSRKVGKELVSIVEQANNSMVLAFRLDSSKISKILALRPKPKKRRPGRPPILVNRHGRSYHSSVTSQYATPFYSFHERENDELKSKPYGGILSESDADTSKTLPQASDRERFDDAKHKAEEEWKQKTATGSSHGDGWASQKVAGPASKIQCINFGGFEIDTWYAAPYPEEYSRNRVLYICEFCLKYMNSEYVAWRHKLKCPAKHPPGDEIYREGSVSVFEVDGRKNPVYCQNLCLLAKLFLGSKTLYYDVEPFLFYVMTEYDELGCHFVGYFSKEKRPSSSNNVSCILTLPTHQRKGYGNLLIDFSYLLTRVEKKTGSPEKPLSDMGLVSYRNYWRLILCYELLEQKNGLSISDISDRTGMTADDIVSALEGLRALVRDPMTGTYALRLDYNFFRSYIEKWEAKKYVRLNSEGLVWTPYVMGRSHLAHLEHAPPLATVAPREGEDEENGENTTRPEEGVQMQINGARNEKTDSDTAEGALKTFTDSKLDVGSPAPSKASTLLPQAEDEQLPVPEPSAATVLPGPPPKSPTSQPQPSGGSPSGKSSQRQLDNLSNKSTNGVPQTPAIPSIPPTRFEIFPPFPGSGRRRAGRPFGSTKRGTATPVRRERMKDSPVSSSPAALGGKSARGKTLFKRSTRGKLQENAEEGNASTIEDSKEEISVANEAQDAPEEE